MIHSDEKTRQQKNAVGGRGGGQNSQFEKGGVGNIGGKGSS